MSNSIIIESPFLFEHESSCPNDYCSIQKNLTAPNQSIYICGSKSITNRVIILAGMSTKSITISNFLFAQDSYYGLLALQKLGFNIECDFKAQQVYIAPPTQFFLTKMIELYLGKAGTLARFLPAVILNWCKTFASSPPLSVTLNADEQLRRRPLSDFITALRKLGAHVNANTLPTKIYSSSLQGECDISGHISGQFLSGLLLSACGAKENITIYRTEKLVQPSYINITLRMIEEFGCLVKHDKDLTKFEVLSQGERGIQNYSVEADASTACYFICLAFLHNFNLFIKNLGFETTQPDYQLVYLLKNSGSQIIVKQNETHILSQKKPIQINLPSKIDCSQYSDQALTIGILALFANKPVEVFGVSHIRHHESNRISCLVKNLITLGFEAYEQEEGFLVYPYKKEFTHVTGVWETYHDHRFVMVGFLLASFCPRLIIKNPRAVEKTAPQFFHVAKNLGFDAHFE